MADNKLLPATEKADPVASLLLKLRRRDSVDDREAAILRDAIETIEDVPAGRTLVRSGDTMNQATLLIDGFLARFKDLAEEQRQIAEIHVPGDFADLHGYLLKRLDHHVGALTAVRIAYVPHQKIIELTEREPHLARLLWLSTLIDSSIQRERLLSIGRRSALARVAHLVCELQLRLELVDETTENGFRFPVTQMDLGDATGLTSVHVNRMLRQLRADGLMTFRGGTVEIQDLPRLQHLAEFDPAYLFLDHEPR